MAGRSMSLDVLVRLRDQLSGPLRSLKNNLGKLASFARGIGLLGAAIGAISFMGPIREAAAFQQQLLDIAGTAELTGSAAFAFTEKVQGRYEALALAIGQSSQTIAEGAGQMIAAGVSTQLVDQTIDDIGRATTAANANFADMSAVGISMLNNLKLPADQMRDSLGALVIAGKLGSFEVKDMAAAFPGLTSGVAKFGVKGREAVNFLASALQIARKGTSDPAQAANNLGNFLDKALSPLTQKNFRKAGVNIEAVMMDAASKGLNPIEAVIQKIGKLTGVSETAIAKYMKKAKANGLEGAEALGYVRDQLEAIGAAGKVGELFQDKQVLDFLIPFLANMEEYKAIKEKVAAATGAITDADFETQMQGINRELVTFGEIGTQATRMVGFAFAQWLPDINAGLMAALGWLRAYDETSGGAVSNTLRFAGAGLLVAAALGTLGFVLPIVGAGLVAIGGLLGVLLSPIGLFIAALSAGAIHVWKNWDRYGGRVTRLWQQAKAGFGQFASSVAERARAIIATGRALAERFGPTVAAGLRRAWNGLASAGGAIGAVVDNAVAAIRGGDWRGAGIIVAEGIADGASALGSLLSSILTSAGGAIAGVDWTGIGRMLSDQILTGLIGLRDTAGAFISGALSVAAARAANVDWSAVGTSLGAKGAEWGLAIGKAVAANIVSAIKGGSDISAVIALKLMSLNWSQIGSIWLAGMRAQFDLLAGLAAGFATRIADEIKAWFAGVDLTEVGARWGAQILAGMRSALEEVRALIENRKAVEAGTDIGALVGAPPAVPPPEITKPVIEPQPTLDTSVIEPEVTQFAGKMKDDLAVTARPVIDTSSLDAALGKAQQLKALIQSIGSSQIVVPTGDWRAPPYQPARTKGGVSDVRPMPGGGQPGGDKQSALDGRTRMAGIQRPVRLDGQVSVTVKVDGPGKVTGVSSNNTQIAAAAGSGRMVGRV